MTVAGEPGDERSVARGAARRSPVQAEQRGLGLTAIDQVAVVVRDLDRAMTRYWTELGVGPWHVYTYGPHRMPRMTYRGADRPYVMKLALAYVGPTMYELIESVEGPSIYEEFLARQGEGLHHLGYYVPD